jgi:hypothetical protein
VDQFKCVALKGVVVFAIVISVSATMGRNRNIGNAAQKTNKNSERRRRMGQNEKFKQKKEAKKSRHTTRETMNHDEDRMADLAVPVIQVGLGLIFFVGVIFVMKNFVL